MNALAQISAQNKVALREGLKIVRNIIATNPYPAGFTTAELFKLAVKQLPPADFKPAILPPRLVARAKNEKEQKLEPLPPHPNHPIRSMKFLKCSILPILEGGKELKIVRTTRIPFNPATVTSPTGKRKGKQDTSHAAPAAAPAPVTVWVWKTIDQSTLPKPQPTRPPPRIFGREVGVGEDWSHLSKRRMRSRFGKVRRDVAAMKLVNSLKKQKTKAKLDA